MKLKSLGIYEGIVLGLPRGGLVVAAEEAREFLANLLAPTLLLIGSLDSIVIDLN